VNISQPKLRSEKFDDDDDDDNNNNSCNTVFPRDIVCLRNTSINTLHKGDDDTDLFCQNTATYTIISILAWLHVSVPS